MHYLTRPITIRLEPDPELIPAHCGPKWTARMMAGYSTFRLRLLPCKRGVRLITGPNTDRLCRLDRVHESPESLAAALGARALDAQVALNEAPEGTALHAYRSDRLWFYLLAIRAVYNEPKIARLWA
jgi:hypothetical protein